jgi:hypothetical protein
MTWLDHLSWPVAVLLALMVGLSPFFPEPHIWEKLKMLGTGTLTRPLDMFDLLFHAAPILLLGLKAIRELRK